MKSKGKDAIENENGAVLIVALLMLAIVTVIGIAATRTSETELQIVGNEVLHEIAFYAAEAGAAYVAENPQFYGVDNITVGGYLDFPNVDDPSEKQTLSSSQSFSIGFFLNSDKGIIELRLSENFKIGRRGYFEKSISSSIWSSNKYTNIFL